MTHFSFLCDRIQCCHNVNLFCYERFFFFPFFSFLFFSILCLSVLRTQKCSKNGKWTLTNIPYMYKVHNTIRKLSFICASDENKGRKQQESIATIYKAKKKTTKKDASQLNRIRKKSFFILIFHAGSRHSLPLSFIIQFSFLV